MIIIELLISYYCVTAGNCTTHTIAVSPEAAAVATCESGDTVTFGSVDWDAVGYNGKWSTDGGAWQFNDYWVWNSDNRWAIIPVANNQLGITSTYFLSQWPKAESAPPHVQYEMFKFLWNDGYGWENWSASKPCWDKWLVIDKNNRAVWNTANNLP
jgi:hypothetical protein